MMPATSRPRGHRGRHPLDRQLRWPRCAVGGQTDRGFPDTHVPRQYLANGHYFALSGASPFPRLVYPTPTDGGLGIHLTLDLAGQARFGPDVEWITDADAPRDYAVDASRATMFAESIRRYWPSITADALQPAYAGLRAKLSGPGQPAVDFRIDGPAEHGVVGVVQLFTIESPGLTASLAIAERIMSTIGATGAWPRQQLPAPRPMLPGNRYGRTFDE